MQQRDSKEQLIPPTSSPEQQQQQQQRASRLTGWNLVLFATAVMVGCSVTALIKAIYAAELPQSDDFRRPLTLELLLFIAMALGLPTELCLTWRDPRPRHDCWSMRQVCLLSFPAVCDIFATALLNLGLLTLSMSAVQILRSSMTVFAALLRWGLLHVKPHSYMWVGMAVNAMALGVVALASSEVDANDTTGSPLVGVTLTLCSALAQAAQFVVEESVLSSGMSPMCVMGIEGAWGVLLMCAVVLPAAYAIPGD